MVSTLILCSTLLGASPEGKAPRPADLAADEAARTRVGRDPDAQVRLALWGEAHGLRAERLKHLAIAVLTDPSHATARGLMGLVDFQGRWQRPEAVAARVGADAELTADLAEYNARRGRVGNNADAHWRLALWCEEKGLKAEATAHLTAVVRLDPGREAAWKRLGCKRHSGRWMTENQIAEERDEIDSRETADRHWRPLLAKWSRWLGDKGKRAEAEKALVEVTDPYAVPAIWATFAAGTTRKQAVAVRIFGQIEAPHSSRALAMLAVFAESPEVRRAATETLRRRDPRDFVGSMIALVRKPLKYRVQPVAGPGSPGALFVEGRRFNVQRIFAPPALPNLPLFPGEPIGYDANGLPVISRYLGPAVQTETRILNDIRRVSLAQYYGHAPADPVTRQMIAEARGNPRSTVQKYNPRPLTVTHYDSTTQTTPEDLELRIPIGEMIVQYERAAAVAQGQLASEVRAVEMFNAEIRGTNERVLQVLRGVTGHDEGEDPQSWAAWWTDQQGYVYQPPTEAPKPTIVENVPLAFIPQVRPASVRAMATGPTTTSTSESTIANNVPHFSCFRAGTIVHTLTGPRPIESVAVGDRVLVEDPAAGALSYQPVLTAFHNRPASLHRIDLGDETLWATAIHRFWKVGRGWVMARDLNVGDQLRTLGGTAYVASVEEGPVEPVFNLEVAAGHSFFVGRGGTLVHDNSLVRPVPRPYDASPSLSALAATQD